MEVPKKLWPLEAHGVLLTQEVGDQLVGSCPFCDAEGHFYCAERTGQWDCKKCNRSGNVYTFLSQIAETYAEAAPLASLKKLGADRGVPSKVLRDAGMGLNPYGFWSLPVRNARGTVMDIREWRPKKNKHQFFSTRGCNVCLFGAEQLGDPKKKDWPVLVCEGEWDAMALRWVLSKLPEEQVVVVGVPGANIFKEQWCDWFMGRHTTLLYDNDDAGDRGALRAGGMLKSFAKTVHYLCWPENLPAGYDIRDFVNQSKSEGINAAVAWGELKKLIRNKHRRDVDGAVEGPSEASSGSGTGSSGKLKPKSVSLEKDVLPKYRKWYQVTEDMHRAIELSLAVVASTAIPGDPVWLFLVGPPGCGKTAVLETMATSPYCSFQSSVGPHTLVSGWRGDSDPSLIPQLQDRTLILKDYTEILSLPLPVQEEIFSTMRGAFDGSVYRRYGNAVVRDYKNVHFSMLAGVTSAIHGNTRATLGERFLKYQLYKKGGNSDDHVMSAIRSIGKEKKRNEEVQSAVERFLEQDFSSQKYAVELSDRQAKRLMSLSQIIAILRAEVDRDWKTNDILYRPYAEVATRLGKQLAKLAMGVAMIRGKRTVDDDVYNLIEEVAFDTAIGFHLDTVHSIMKAGGSASRDQLSEIARIPRATLQRNLDDLTLLGAVKKKPVNEKVFTGRGNKFLYVVSDKLVRLWKKARVGLHTNRFNYPVKRRFK